MALTIEHVRRVLIPASYSAFAASMIAAAAIFDRGRAFDLKAALLSDLASPVENPHGYGFAAIGMAICAVLLAPAALVFYRRLRSERPRLAMVGAMLFAVGLAAMLAMAALAPWTRGYPPLHVDLAFAAFLGFAGGTFFHLIAAGAHRALIACEGVVLAFLGRLYFGPELFDNRTLLTSTVTV